MTDEYTEVFLKWADGERSDVTEWLEAKGLSIARMRGGLLVTGSRSQVERAFDVSLESREPPIELPIPAALLASVKSLTVPRRRSYHP